jgi:hypothetical protein
MAYIKAKEKKELLELLDLIAKGSWTEKTEYYSDIGSTFYTDFLELDKNWKKKAKRLKKSLK